MANENQIDFKVRFQREGVTELAGELQKIETSAENLAQAATAAGAGVERLENASKDASAAVADLGTNAQQVEAEVNQLATAEDKADAQARELGDGTDGAAKSVKDVGKAAVVAGSELGELAQAVDAKTRAIKAGLQAEQSEIELQRQHLSASKAEQQATLVAAQAKGDESAATRAGNALRQIESDQLALVARAKRAEAAAVEQATAARRDELAAIGPLNAAHANELRAADNHARALRVEAAAADQASQRARELGAAHKSAAGTTDQLSGRVDGLSQVLGRMAGALGAAFTFRELVTAAAQMEQLRSGLTAVTGDATKAGQELEFVRAVAVRIGADVTEVGKAFLGLAAATKGTAVEGEPTRQVFEAVATAMGKAGKSSAETSLALQALSQMASKGIVQMEELRGQLGEQLPGALNAAAKGLGITTADLIKLVEEGKIAASDLFPALTKGLNDLYGGAPNAQTLSQEITNIKNSFTEMAANIGDAGGLTALKTGAEVVQAAFVGLDAGVVAAGKSIGTVIAAVVNRDFAGLKQAFADIEKEAKDKVIKAAQHNETLRNSLKASGDQAVLAALAQQDLATKTQQASAAAAAGANDFVKLQNGYKLVYDSIRENIAQQEKSFIARDAEGKASVALAAAFGTEAEQRSANAAASARSAAELEKLAKLKLTELAVQQEELKSLKAEAALLPVVDATKKEQIATLEKQIGLRQQDTEKAVAQAQAGRLAAEAAKVEAEAYKDNSARVNELREAYERAKSKLEEVRVAKVTGKATTEDLTKSELAAGKAALLYRDALEDQKKAIEARKNLQLADLDVQGAAVRLAIEQQRAIYEVAKARGDERTAAAASNEIKRLEIELLLLTAQAKRAEAEAALASLQIKKAELVAIGEYNGVKKLEIEAAIKGAEVKRLEGDIAEVTANKLRQLGDVQRSLKGDTDKTTESFDRQVQSMERLGGGVQKVGSGYRNKDGLTSDAQGNVQQQFVWNRSSIIDYLKQAGIEDLLAEQLAKQFTRADGTVSYMASAAQLKWGGKYSTLSEALGKMVDYYKYNDEGKNEAANTKRQIDENNTALAAPQHRGGSAPQPMGVSGGTATGGTYISNITIDGAQSTVRFADAQSQQTSESLLRSLARAKGASIR